jgi:hypothetical protein
MSLKPVIVLFWQELRLSNHAAPAQHLPKPASDSLKGVKLK